MKHLFTLIAAMLCVFSASAKILETEPNDNFTTANFLAAGDTMQGKTCQSPEADYFQIILPEDGILRVFTSISANTPNPINLPVQLYSKYQGSFGAQNPAIGADSIPVLDTLDWGCMAADTFYLVIAANSFGFGYCWDYQISYEVVPPAFSNDAEPNGTSAQAIDLPYNTPAEGHLGFNIVPGLSALNEAEDYYRIITPTDGIIRVFVTAENAGASVSLSVSLLAKNNGSFGDQYPPVGGSGVAATDTLYWGCQAADTFFLRFFTNNITYCGFSYRISYDVLPAYFANDVEPNGTSAQALDLPYNTPAEGHLGYRIYTGSGSSADPGDYYKIVTPVSGLLRIFIASEMAGVPAYSMPVSLYSKYNGWFGDQYFLPGSNGIPNSDTMAWACIDADTFFLQVSINNVLDCGISYRVWYEMDSAAYAEDAEPNNTYATASPLPYNTPVEGQLYYKQYPGGAPANDDVYRLIVPQAGTLRLFTSAEYMEANSSGINVQFSNKGGGNIDSRLAPFGQFGTPVADTFYFGCVSADTFYFRLYSTGVYDCGFSYELRYDMIPAVFGPDPEPNNNFAEATPLAIDSIAEGQLNYYSTGSADYYRIVLTDGVLRLYTDAAISGAGPASFRVELYSKTFSYMGYNDLSLGVNNQPISDTLLQTLSQDTFYLKLTFTNNDCGSYRIQYRLPSALLAAISSSDFLCHGDGNGAAWVNVTSGTPAYNYSWSGGTPNAAGDSITAPNGGTYSVTITDASGFSVDLSTFINEPPAINWTITSQPATCFGVNDGSITIAASGGTPPLEYSIDGINFQSSGSFSSLDAGSYDIIVRDDAGCTKDTSGFSVTGSSNITAVYSINQPTPGNSDGGIKINPIGGTSPYEYSIDGVTYQTSSSFTNLPAGTYPIFVTDANGCEFTDSVTLGFPIGISGVNEDAKVEVYPNPANEYLFISAEAAQHGEVIVFVQNYLGKEVFRIKQTASSINLQLDLANYPSGIYFLGVEMGRERLFRKFVIAR